MPPDPARPVQPTSHEKQQEQIEQALPYDDLLAFRGVYLETARRLKDQQGTPGTDGEPANPEVAQLDFEFVLFTSALIDYDHILKLIAKYSGQDPKKPTISREQLLGLIQSDANFFEEREEITDYIRSLREGDGLDEAAIRADYGQFKAERQAKEVKGLAQGPRSDDRVVLGLRQHHPPAHDLRRRAAHRPDGAARPRLAWHAASGKLALMDDLVPLLNKRAHGRDISGTQRLRAGGRLDDSRQADTHSAQPAIS